MSQRLITLLKAQVKDQDTFTAAAIRKALDNKLDNDVILGLIRDRSERQPAKMQMILGEDLFNKIKNYGHVSDAC